MERAIAEQLYALADELAALLTEQMPVSPTGCDTDTVQQVLDKFETFKNNNAKYFSFYKMENPTVGDIKALLNHFDDNLKVLFYQHNFDGEAYQCVNHHITVQLDGLTHLAITTG